VSAHRAKYPVATMCRVLGVSTSGYYSWVRRGLSPRMVSDRVLASKIRAIHEQSRGTYGAPRVHVELAEQHVHVAKKRVARLMRTDGIAGVSRRKRVRTTRRNPEAQPAPDLVQRHFSAISPDWLWVADITYVPTWQGFLYLAVVMDAFSRRIVGWAMAGHMRTELVLDALNMAVQQRRPVNVVGHSDHGSQYTSLAYGKRCKEAGVRPSMGSVGDTRVRADRPQDLTHASRRPPGGVRVHRRVVQHPAAALRLGVSVPGGVRAAVVVRGGVTTSVLDCPRNRVKPNCF